MALDDNILEQALNLRSLSGLKEVFATKKELENVPGGTITFATAEDVIALFKDLEEPGVDPTPGTEEPGTEEETENPSGEDTPAE